MSQSLTDRQRSILDFISSAIQRSAPPSYREIAAHWPRNVWAGTSVESQDYVDRIDHLLKVPADIRFLSVEPLLGRVKIKVALLRRIQWVIVGGESGPHARPMNADWARDIRDQCVAAKVPFFFKQWGVYNSRGERRSKKAAGRVLDGRTWDEMPVLQKA